MLPPPQRSTLFPYTTLFRSIGSAEYACSACAASREAQSAGLDLHGARVVEGECANGAGADRKSTRLNSSHVSISYAVFCLKKKKHTKPLSNIVEIAPAFAPS